VCVFVYIVYQESSYLEGKKKYLEAIICQGRWQRITGESEWRYAYSNIC